MPTRPGGNRRSPGEPNAPPKRATARSSLPGPPSRRPSSAPHHPNTPPPGTAATPSGSGPPDGHRRPGPATPHRAGRIAAPSRSPFVQAEIASNEGHPAVGNAPQQDPDDAQPPRNLFRRQWTTHTSPTSEPSASTRPDEHTSDLAGTGYRQWVGWRSRTHRPRSAAVPAQAEVDAQTVTSGLHDRDRDHAHDAIPPRPARVGEWSPGRNRTGVDHQLRRGPVGSTCTPTTATGGRNRTARPTPSLRVGR